MAEDLEKCVKCVKTKLEKVFDEKGTLKVGNNNFFVE
jgi:hypothetical protein